MLAGLLTIFHLQDRTASVLRALDKLGKVGRDKVIDEMVAAGADANHASLLTRLGEIGGTNDEILLALDALVAGSETGRAGVAGLRELVAATRAAGVKPERLRIDPSIARGLDYYTGTVYETFLGRLPGIGSVCSGGRYDNLAGLYTKEELPGVGASLGLDRLLAALEELGLIQKVSTPAPVFIPFFDATRLYDYLRLAAAVRAAGVGVGALSRAKKAGPAAQVRRPPRVPFRADRRRNRVGGRNLPAKRPGSRHEQHSAARPAPRRWQPR